MRVSMCLDMKWKTKMAWISSLVNLKDQQRVITMWENFMGHSLEAQVLQEAKLPKDLATSDGVKSLFNVYISWAKMRKPGSVKRSRRMTPVIVKRRLKKWGS